MEKPELTDEQKPIRHQSSAYARVSTDTPMQITSFEIQQKYYEKLVAQHLKMFGTTLQQQEKFKEMPEDDSEGLE